MGRGENSDTKSAPQSRSAPRTFRLRTPDRHYVDSERLHRTRKSIELYNTVRTEQVWQDCLVAASDESGDELRDVLLDFFIDQYHELDEYQDPENWIDEETTYALEQLAGVNCKEMAFQLRFELSGEKEPEMLPLPKERPSVKGPVNRSARGLIAGRQPSAVHVKRAQAEADQYERLKDENGKYWQDSALPADVQKDYRIFGASRQLAERWHYFFGFDAVQWRQWSEPFTREGRVRSLNPIEAATWLNEDFEAKEALAWEALAVEPMKAAELRRRGTTPEQYAAKRAAA